MEKDNPPTMDHHQKIKNKLVMGKKPKQQLEIWKFGAKYFVIPSGDIKSGKEKNILARS